MRFSDTIATAKVLLNLNCYNVYSFGCLPISELNAQLSAGIRVAALGEDGAVRRLNEAKEWMRRHGMV